jgi:hypothetical protein
LSPEKKIAARSRAGQRLARERADGARIMMAFWSLTRAIGFAVEEADVHVAVVRLQLVVERRVASADDM